MIDGRKLVDYSDRDGEIFDIAVDFFVTVTIPVAQSRLVSQNACCFFENSQGPTYLESIVESRAHQLAGRPLRRKKGTDQIRAIKQNLHEPRADSP